MKTTGAHLPLRWDLAPVQVGRNFWFPEINDSVDSDGAHCWKARETVGHFGKETAIRKSMRMYSMYGSCLRNLCSGTSHQCSIRVSYRMAILKWNPSTQQVVKWWFLWPSIPSSLESSDALGCRLCELLLLLLLFFRRLSSGLCCLQGNTFGSEAGILNSWWETRPLSGALVSGKKTVRNQPETTSQTTSQTLKAPLKPVFLGSWKLLVAQGGTMLGPRQRIPLLAFALPHTSESRF